MDLHQRFRSWGIGRPNFIRTDLSSYQSRVNDIYASYHSITNLTNDKLKQYATSLKKQAQTGTALDQLLAPTYALIKEVFIRQMKINPFDIQLLAAIPLHERKLIEMQTGEGKTFTAVFAAVLNAWVGKGVHILTFNDYLAQRDAQWMATVYQFLGLEVGYISNEMTLAQKQEAYAKDITYATAKQVGFDFLRSKLAYEEAELLLRPFHFAIVDEADAILIDEARNPLVLAGRMEATAVDLRPVALFVQTLQESEDYLLSTEARTVYLTAKGLQKAETYFKVENLVEDAHFELHTAINLSLQAHTLLIRDIDYLVKDNRIYLIDEFTGRVVEDRRWRNGLQSAVEAKEHLPLQSDGSVLNSISLQHLIQMYPGVAAMTATAQSSAEEFAQFYGLPTMIIPPHKPSQRRDYPDQIYVDKASKIKAVLEEVKQSYRIGQPVLIGTLTVQESEDLAQRFRQEDIPCQVLNAKNDEEEAAIIADAGKVGAVTIATNMAGRGTDIKLGGKDESEKAAVKRYGGLYVIGTNRHESVRIDQQLRGRAGRQGDPGKSRFFISFEDDLMIKYKLQELLPKKLRQLRGEAPLQHPKIKKVIRSTQRIMENQLMDMRKNLYQYAAFTEKQRVILQQERQDILKNIHQLSHFHPSIPSIIAANPEQLDLIQSYVLLQYDKYWAAHLDLLSHLREGIHFVRLGGQSPLRSFRKQADQLFQALYETLAKKIADWIEKVMREEGAKLDLKELERPASTWTYVINDNPFEDQLSILLLDNANTGMHVDFVAAPFLFTIAMMRWMKQRRQQKK